MDDLHAIYKNLPKNELIVDIRTEDEYLDGHVPGAKNIPVDVIDRHTDELKKFQNIYLYCRSGGRVSVATEILSAQGLQNLNSVLNGGFPNWAARGYETSFDS